MPQPSSGSPLLLTPLYRGIFFTALATLLLELALIRILSFTIWHHFGYVMISTALLGFGASGTFLAIRPGVGERDLLGSLTRVSLWAAASAVGALLFVAAVPLHPMELLQGGGQPVVFVAYQLVTTVPFFFSGLVVALSMRAGAERVDRVYFWDLIGAGLGCIVAIGLMNRLAPPGAAMVAAGAFAAAAFVYAGSGRGRALAAGAAALCLVAAPFARELPFTPANSKEYTLHLALGGFEPIETHWTALFRTDVVEQVREAKVAPHPPGLSREADPDTGRPGHYLSHDATASTGVYGVDAAQRLDHLEQHVIRLPYLVTKPDPRVLVIGVGGGRDVVAASQFGASHVVGVDLDPIAMEMLGGSLDAISRGFFRRPDVELVADEGRHYIRTAGERFDLIQLTGVDTLSAMNSGAYVLAENYLYTVEAFHDYLDALGPGGVLSFAMGNFNPNRPRAAGRIVSVANRALRERGIERPQDHIAVIDSRSLYAEVLIRTTPFTRAESERLRALAEQLAFRPLWLPGLGGHPVFEQLASLGGEAMEGFLAEQHFLLTPVEDDQPFFLSFFRWADLLAPGALAPSHSTALGQIVLLLLLATLTLLGLALILAPLFAFQRRGLTAGGAQGIGLLVYFSALGLGFMLYEISLIQRFVIFLGYPTYSVTVTLGSLLVSLGFGSFLSRRWVGRERRALPVAVALLAVLMAFYVYGLPPLQDAVLGAPLAVRAATTIALLVPLGLVLGIFFPLGIREAARIHPDLVPWGWAVNGCASVTGGVLAIVLAMSFGFTSVWLVSLGIYVTGAAGFLWATRTRAAAA